MNHMTLEIAKHEIARHINDAEHRNRQRATAAQRPWVRRTTRHR